MFLKLVKSILGAFVSANELLINVVNDNYIILIANDFDIIVSYDDREDEVYIDFDLSRYLAKRGYQQELQLPVLLNINNVCRHLGISIADFVDSKNLELEERVRLKSNQLEIVWDHLSQNRNYKDLLSNMHIKDRLELKKSSDLQILKYIIAKAHDAFKAHEYEKAIELLKPHIEKLSAHDKKILEYSLKKVGR